MSGETRDTATTLLESLPDALLLIGDERVTMANAAARSLFGAKGSELLDRHLETLLGTDASQRLLRRLRGRVREELGSFSIRLVLHRLDDGRPVLTDVRAARLSRGNGHLAGALALVLREAKDLARAENLIASLADLASAEEGLRGPDCLLESARPMFDSLGWWAGLLRTSPSGVEVLQLFAPSSVEDHPIVSFARRVREMSPLSWDWFPVAHRVYKSGEPLYVDDVASHLATVEGLAPEFIEKLRRSGFTRAAWVPVHSGRGTSHVLLVVGPDLTEHDLAAMQLFAAKLGSSLRMEKLQRELVRQERLAAVGEMAGVLAHEVRNPLAVIFNAVAGLQKQLGEGEDRDGLLPIIHEEADRLKRVVRDLVDFARPSVPEIRPMAIHSVVKSAIETVRVELRKGEVPLTKDLPADLPWVDADPHLLLRALLNVFDNAYRSVGEGGGVQVWAKTRAESWVELVVRNDGPPLGPEQIEKAFQPFFTTRATGTGLGLTVVKRVVEDLGGKVRLGSDESGVSLAIRLRVSAGQPSGPEEQV